MQEEFKKGKMSVLQMRIMAAEGEAIKFVLEKRGSPIGSCTIPRNRTPLVKGVLLKNMIRKAGITDKQTVNSLANGALRTVEFFPTEITPQGMVMPMQA